MGGNMSIVIWNERSNDWWEWCYIEEKNFLPLGGIFEGKPMFAVEAEPPDIEPYSISGLIPSPENHFKLLKWVKV